jgi:hypothetical protein
MSRGLWALLGGVVLVAIAALVWTAGDRTNVTPAVSAGPTAVAPAPVRPAPPAPAPAAPEPAPSPTAPPAPAPDVGQQAATPPSSPPSPETPPAPPVAEAPLPPPAPGRETAEVQGVYAPKNLAQLVGTWAYSTEDCERLFQRSGGGWVYRQPVDKFAQAAIVQSTKKILLPSATCQIESASEAEGALKVSADCADSISYTSRSVMIALRSPTELMYSASGDPALATTLKKCSP